MKLQKTILTGVLAGLGMGVVLFLTGAIAARLVYGPQMAPAGKFRPEQINAWYFIWTKLVIGSFLGVLLSILYEALPLSKRIGSAVAGLKYAFPLWVVVYLWGVSHPFVYEGYASVLNRNQLFWMVYSLGGFLGLGIAFGWVRKRVFGPAA
jgi:hypothetical protein